MNFNNPDQQANNANFNLFNTNSNNFENLFGPQNNQPQNEGNFENNENNHQEGNSTIISPDGTIQIPNQLGNIFDETAVAQLSRGAPSTKKLVTYLTTQKGIHWCAPHECGFFELSLLAAGKIKFVEADTIKHQEVPFFRGQTEKVHLIEQCLQSDIIRPYVPWIIVLKSDIKKRVIQQVNWNVRFQAGLIDSLDRQGFADHLQSIKDQTARDFCKKDKRKLHTWYTQSEPLWVPSNNSKSDNVSRGLANKMDLIGLLENDKTFVKLQMNNEVNGVQDQIQLLKKQQEKQMGTLQTLDQRQQHGIRTEVMGEVHREEMQNMKTMLEMVKSIYGVNEPNQLKFIELILGLGIKSVDGWKFNGLVPYNYQKLNEGIVKTLKMIRANGISPIVKQVCKMMLADQLNNFMTQR